MLKSKTKLLLANLLAEKATEQAVDSGVVHETHEHDFFVDQFNYYHSILDQDISI